MLINGLQACSCSNEWRLECEAQDIYKLKNVLHRRLMLDNIGIKRGKEEADKLREIIMQFHRNNKNGE